MSELHAGFDAQSTEETLYQVQASLLPFVERPDDYNLAPVDVDHYVAICGGLGSVLLSYNRRNMAHVRFISEDDFEVTAAYRLHCGIYVSSLPLRNLGAVEVQYPSEDGATYRPKLWPDGGYSLTAPGSHDLDLSMVWRLGRAVSRLSAAFSQTERVQLGIVK